MIGSKGECSVCGNFQSGEMDHFMQQVNVTFCQPLGKSETEKVHMLEQCMANSIQSSVTR